MALEWRRLTARHAHTWCACTHPPGLRNAHKASTHATRAQCRGGRTDALLPRSSAALCWWWCAAATGMFHGGALSLAHKLSKHPGVVTDACTNCQFWGEEGKSMAYYLGGCLKGGQTFAVRSSSMFVVCVMQALSCKIVSARAVGERGGRGDLRSRFSWGTRWGPAARACAPMHRARMRTCTRIRMHMWCSIPGSSVARRLVQGHLCRPRVPSARRLHSLAPKIA